MPLPITRDMILGVLRRRLIQRRFGLEVADAKIYPAMFDTVPQHA